MIGYVCKYTPIELFEGFGETCAVLEEMPENFEEAYQGVLDAVVDGTVSEERIDDSLRRIYRVKLKSRVL